LFFKVIYSSRYQVDIGPHVFPTAKYQRVHARLLETGVVHAGDIVEPQPASWDELALVHTSDYLTKMREGTLSSGDIAEIELPWSVETVEGFRLMVGGTVQAAKIACGLGEFTIHNCKVSIHIGGGLHHAFPNHGEGFCPFNDVAVAVRVLQARGIERVAIVDCDVHHGNGTAFIFESDPRVFTFSIHQQHNYPMWKPRGSLDIGLPDGAGDGRFLRELAQALPTVMASEPRAVFYLAGADPYEGDQLGGLRMTREGLRRRDRLVIETVRAAGVPLVVTLAGGYARHLEDTVAIHVATIEEAKNATTKARRHKNPS
jgi:acetoin utilization deacetylase AcuC-like enzyme